MIFRGAILFLILTSTFYPQKFERLKAASSNISNTFLNRNLISSNFSNNGLSDIITSTGNSGLVYPKGSGKTSVFTSGFLWGAKIQGDPLVRVGGSVYRSGLQPGRILNSNLPQGQLIAEDPNSPSVRIYRVRRDVYPGGPFTDFIDEIRDEGGTSLTIRNQYETDWTNWPASSGAPFEDKNGNGIYDPATDIPGYLGADQTIWYVANDLNPAITANLYGSQPLGMEVQVTVWCYNRNEILNHICFKQHKLINKSNTTFNNTYISIWSDPDIGNMSDDLAGCDTLLNLGYAYNGVEYDDTYEYTPPAVGYTLLKGPSVLNGDSILNMKVFYFVTDAYLNPFDPSLEAWALYYYNCMQGKIGQSGQYFFNPISNTYTTFAVSGDPLKKEGWIDELVTGTNDRRMGVGSGPFSMAPGDTQTIAFSTILAEGKDRDNSIRLLRYYSTLSKQMYNESFNLASVPPIPNVTISDNENSIQLSWDNDSSNAQTIEKFNQEGYVFQGYNVYQLYSDAAIKGNSVKIATFDKPDGITQLIGTVMNPATGYPENGVEQFGSDNGIQRSINITYDWIDQKYFIPGKKYYFAVTAYAVNTLANPNNAESLLKIVEIVFHSGQGTQYGNLLKVAYPEGTTGFIKPVIIDPFQLTGHTYKIIFDTLSGHTGIWDLYDTNLNIKLLDDQTNISGDFLSPVIDGIQFKILLKNYDIFRLSMTSNGNGPISSIKGFDNTTPPGFNAFSADWFRDAARPGSIFDLPGMQSKGGFYFITAGNSSLSHESAVDEWLLNGDSFPVSNGKKYEIRFTEKGGKAGVRNYKDSLLDVTFETWYLGKKFNDPTDDVRFVPRIQEVNNNGIFDFHLDHLASPDNNDPYSDYIYIMEPEPNSTPGEEAYLAAIERIINHKESPTDEIRHVGRLALMNYNQLQGSGGENEMPETGTTFLIEVARKPIPGVDEFLITDSVITGIKTSEAPNEYSLSQNYPNPFNPSTTISFNIKERGFVDLTVFNILGQKVKTIVNGMLESGTHKLIFNGEGFASGIYIYRLQANGFVSSKKMVIIK